MTRVLLKDWYEENKEPKPLPGCGHTSGVFTPDLHGVYFEGGYVLVEGRMKAWCNTVECEQRFWLYPVSGRVTRRNTGETLSERRARLGHY